MSNTIIFSFASLIYIFILFVVFFSKKYVKTLENKIYSLLIITTFTGLVTELLGVIFLLGDIWIFSFLQRKLFLVYLISWILLFTIYTIYTFKKVKILEKNKFIFSLIIYLISIITIFVLPTEIYNKDNSIYTYGLSVDFVYIFSFICIVIIIFNIIKNIKYMFNKKALPISLFVLLGIIVVVVQMLNPGLLLITSAQTIITFLMYFTIENPDIKMLEQIRGANAYASKNNYEKEMFLYSVSKNLKGITNYIKSDGSKINNLSNDKEIKDLALNISLNSSRINSYIDNVLEINENNIKVCDNKYDVKQLLNNTFRLRNVQNISLNESIPRYLYGDNIIFKEALINLIDYLKKNFSVSVNYIVKENICRILVIFNKENIEFTEEVQKIKEKLNQIGGNIVFGFQDNEIIAILDQKIVLQNNDKKILVPQNIDISRYVINEKIIFTKYDCVKDFFEKALEKYDLILLDKDLFDDIYLDKNVIYEKLGYEPIIKLLSNKKNNGYNIDVIDLKKFEELIKHLEKD